MNAEENFDSNNIKRKLTLNEIVHNVGVSNSNNQPIITALKEGRPLNAEELAAIKKVDRSAE